jgi:chromosome segregation ATPase
VSNLKNDHFYEDDERFYNLNYTHDQLRDLLNKIDKGCILTKEQYTQLIEEIGLDNISTFDLNYYNLKNLPIIPVRVSELFNDVGYDVRKRVDAELETIYGLIEDDTEQLNNLKKYLEDINITETLNSIDKANDRVEYLNEVVTGINGVIFSFERSIDLIKDIASELSIEFEILKHRQDSNEELMRQANNKTLMNANDILKLTELYFTLDKRHDEIDNKFKEVIADIIKRDDEICTLINSLNDEFVRISDELKSLIDILASSIEKIAKIDRIEKEVNINKESIIDIYDKYNKIEESITELLIKIRDLDGKIIELEQDIIKLKKEVNEINNNINEINSSINKISNKVESNSQDIELNKLSIINLERTNVDIIEDLNEIRNDVSKNTNNISKINTRLDNIDDELEEFNNEIIEMQEDISLSENRITSLEEQALTFATKALVNSLALKVDIKEEEEIITIKLILDDKPLSSIDIPFFTKKEEEKDRIARTMNAWTNYSITAIGTEQLDTTARVDKGKTDYSTTK